MDVHGGEEEILTGAERTLTSSVALIIEAYNNRFRPGGLLFWELCSALGVRGFRPVDVFGLAHREYDGTLWQMDICFIRDDWEGFAYPHFS